MYTIFPAIKGKGIQDNLPVYDEGSCRLRGCCLWKEGGSSKLVHLDTTLRSFEPNGWTPLHQYRERNELSSFDLDPPKVYLIQEMYLIRYHGNLKRTQRFHNAWKIILTLIIKHEARRMFSRTGTRDNKRQVSYR